MPISKYLKLTIGNKQIQVTSAEDLPISIDYALEDPENFQNKKSAEVLSIKVPATLMNDIAGNTFRNPDIMDLTAGEVFRSNQPFTMDENGYEIMSGKAFLNEVTHNDQPLEYEYDLFGDNADWKIDLEEKTLFDFLQHISFIFSKDNIIASWDFDGTDPLLPYVFAPIRYRGPMGGSKIGLDQRVVPEDGNVEPAYLKPSLSKYWIIYWALQSIGFRIQSNFMDLPYFRRQVMPWTWGGFLVIEGSQLDQHKFRAKTPAGLEWATNDSTGPNPTPFIDANPQVDNDSIDGMFDNNDDYEYAPAGAYEMVWTYNNPDFGALDITFSIIIDARLYAQFNSDASLMVYWYVNGAEQSFEQLFLVSATLLGAEVTDIGIKTAFFTAKNINLGDKISCRIKVRVFKSNLGHAGMALSVAQFQIDFFRIPLGGTINLSNYNGFKKYKFLDFLRGVIDEFNLSINTDPINKAVYIEPTHSYSITDDPTDTLPGYFLDDFIDWNNKRDLSKNWVMQNYNDYDRELIFRYRDDANDGAQKILQDRSITTLAAGKYVFPERFKTGKKEIENRFFSKTVHFEASQWKYITGVSPQMVCLIPENISNTSNSESENTFVPKSCYYKGLVTGVGGWVFDRQVDAEGNVTDSGERTNFPYLFSVNYKDGGQNDPILSYCDEKISDGEAFVIGKGLLKRFYWQRLAIMRNGQFYTTWFRLKNVDVVNQLHREHISFGGHRWELIQIKGYKPLQDLSTSCFMRRWAPVTIEDFNSTFPSEDAILTDTSSNPLDTKYSMLLCLTSDIPR